MDVTTCRKWMALIITTTTFGKRHYFATTTNETKMRLISMDVILLFYTILVKRLERVQYSPVGV